MFITVLSEATQLKKYEITVESQQPMRSEAQHYVQENLHPAQTISGRKLANKYVIAKCAVHHFSSTCWY